MFHLFSNSSHDQIELRLIFEKIGVESLPWKPLSRSAEPPLPATLFARQIVLSKPLTSAFQEGYPPRHRSQLAIARAGMTLIPVVMRFTWTRRSTASIDRSSGIYSCMLADICSAFIASSNPLPMGVTWKASSSLYLAPSVLCGPCSGISMPKSVRGSTTIFSTMARRK